MSRITYLGKKFFDSRRVMKTNLGIVLLTGLDSGSKFIFMKEGISKQNSVSYAVTFIDREVSFTVRI